MARREVAEKAGIARQIIDYLASGSRSTCQTDTAKAIADVLDVPVAELFVLPERKRK